MAAHAGEAGDAVPGGPKRVRWAEAIATTKTRWKKTIIIEKDDGWMQISKAGCRSSVQAKMVKPTGKAAWARGGVAYGFNTDLVWF